MKTKWITPKTEIEVFTPDEYIAVCWGVACDCDDANKVEQSLNNDETHRWEHCGTIGNQWLADSNNDGIAEAMYERNTDGLGRLPCNIEGDIRTIKPNDFIKWTTSVGFGPNMRVWHHQGTVEATNPTKPNAS